MSIRTEYVEANGLQFEVDVAGQGDRLALCLHGFPECKHSWRRQLPFLAELGYQAWAPNLRGYGNTSRPRGRWNYRIDELVEDVAGLIDASGCKEVMLLGHDWGGAVAWEFMSRGLRPVEHFVILNIPHPALMMQALLKNPAQRRRSWYMGFFQLPMVPERMLGKNRAKAVAKVFQDTSSNPGAFSDEDLEAYRSNASKPGALTAMLNYYRAIPLGLPSLNKGKNRGKIKTPTLMLWGEDDHALGKELTYGTERFVEDLHIEYFPGVSHWILQEVPDKVNEHIASWLES